MSILPDPWRSLTGEIAAMKRRLRDVEVRSPWTGSGMSPQGEGTTVFDPGLIPNNALGAPTIPGVAGVEAANFSIGVMLAEVAGVDLTVPTGTSGLLISATAHIFASNTSAAADMLWASLKVGTVTSTPIGTPWPVGEFVTASCSLGTVVTGLTAGSTVRLGIWSASSVGTITADVDNTAIIAASLTWQP